MDDKQINMIRQYYNMPAESKTYCKECGCAIDAAAEEHYERDKNHSRLTMLNLILFAAIAVLSIALIICAHIISDLKKSESYNSVYAHKSNNEIYCYIGNKSL